MALRRVWSQHLINIALQFPLLSIAVFAAKAGCAAPANLAGSVVSITMRFSEEEKMSAPALLGIRGTGWFLSPQLLVTAGHVAESMRLSSRDWKEAEIAQGSRQEHLQLRLRNVAGPDVEKIGVIELKEAFAGAESLRIRREALAAGESVFSLGYPSNRLRIASGLFVKKGDDTRLAGTDLFELFDGNDRLALDHGASGAPVLDCEGQVVAVVTNVFTATISFMSQPIRVSTAWGSPNVVAVPITALEDRAER
jgi:Trypsin-like peptidase domain